MMVSNKPDHQGEHEVSRKPLRGECPGDFRHDRGDYACVFFISHARLRARWAPGIPRALCFARGREVESKTRAKKLPRDRESVWARHCAERSDQAIQLASFLAPPKLDCFAEPVIGRAFARPVGSQ
jgi:hypothetical protein